jgi:hypothetical protein
MKGGRGGAVGAWSCQLCPVLRPGLRSDWWNSSPGFGPQASEVGVIPYSFSGFAFHSSYLSGSHLG